MPEAKSEKRRARLAVVGLGKMGIMHTAMTRACPEAELVGLVDRAAGLARQVKSMGADVATYEDLGAMLAEAKPDGVILSTPQFTHRALIEQCLSAGASVLTEKPLAHQLDDAKAAASAAEKAAKESSLTTHVAFMKGHDPLFRRAALLLRPNSLKELNAVGEGELQAGPGAESDIKGLANLGVLGELKGFQASVHLSQVFKKPKGWTFTKEQAGGGVLINTGVHLLFLLRLFFGPLNRVACLATPVHAETEDTVSALVEHTPIAGARLAGSVHVSWSTGGHETEGTSVVVEGTNGNLWIEDNLLKAWLVKPAGGLAQGWHAWSRAELESSETTHNMSPEYSGEGYFRETQNFARAILGDPRGFGYSAGVGLELQAVLDAYYRSAESDGAWTEPDTDCYYGK